MPAIRSEQPQVLGQLNSKQLSGTFHQLDDNVEKQLQTQTKMFLTYLKNQTLDSTVNTQEMMQGMMTMMMAGQQLKTNKLLGENNELQMKNLELSKGQYMGKTVLYETNQLTFDGEAKEITVMVPGNSQRTGLFILDENGHVARSMELNKKPGRNSFIWDGKDDSGHSVQPGNYRVVGQAVDQAGEVVAMPVYLEVVINEIGWNSQGEKVPMSNGMEINLDSNKVLVEKISHRQPYAKQKSTIGTQTTTIE